MTVLAIDPGPKESGYAIYDAEAKELVQSGKEENNTINRYLRDRHFHAVYIERIASYGMAVGKETFETCEWVGRFYETAKRAGLNVQRIYRKAVKLHMCQSIKANDANIATAVRDKFGGERCKGTKAAPGPLYGVSKDAWQALALAITGVETGAVEEA